MTLRTAAGCNWVDLLLITVAMVGARTFAMAANRIIDRHIDARNPRTAEPGAGHRRGERAHGLDRRGGRAGRASSPRRRCSTRSAWCWRRSPWCRWSSTRTPSGSPTGRTRSSALAQAVAPVGAWLAVTGTFAGSGPAWVLGVAVGLWIGGFDLIYACQDAEVDRADRGAQRAGPVRRAVRAARCRPSAHVVTFALFVWFGALVGLGWLWWIGLALTAAAFVYEHVDRHARRPVPGQPGVLHRQRLRRASPCSSSRSPTCRALGRRLLVDVAACRASRDGRRARSGMRTPWIVGVSGASGTPYAAAVLRGAARRRLSRSTWWSPGPPG